MDLKFQVDELSSKSFVSMAGLLVIYNTCEILRRWKLQQDLLIKFMKS